MYCPKRTAYESPGSRDHDRVESLQGSCCEVTEFVVGLASVAVWTPLQVSEGHGTVKTGGHDTEVGES